MSKTLMERENYPLQLEPEHLFAIKLLLACCEGGTEKSLTPLVKYLGYNFHHPDSKEIDELQKNVNTIIRPLGSPADIQAFLIKIEHLLREYRCVKTLFRNEQFLLQTPEEEVQPLVDLIYCLQRIFIKKDPVVKGQVLGMELDSEKEGEFRRFRSHLLKWQTEYKYKRETALDVKLDNEIQHTLKLLAQRVEQWDCLQAQHLIDKIKQLSPKVDFNQPIEGKTLFDYACAKKHYNPQIHILIFKAGMKIPAAIPAMYFIRLLRDTLLLNDYEGFQRVLREAKQYKQFDVNLSDLNGIRLVQYAIVFEKPEFLKLLMLDNTLDLLVTMPKTFSNLLDLALKNNTDSIISAFHAAPKTNTANVAIAMMVLNRIVAEKLDYNFDLSPYLEYSINIPSLPLCEMLIKMGADVNYPLYLNYYPLVHAVVRLNEAAGGGPRASYSIRGQEVYIKIINALIRSGATLTLTRGVGDYGETGSLLFLLVTKYRMEEWDFNDLPCGLQEDWELLRNVILAAHKNDLQNLYQVEKKGDREAMVLVTQNKLLIHPKKAPLMTLNGHKIRLEGNTPGIMGEAMVFAYNTVFMRNPEYLSTLTRIQREIFLNAGNANPSAADHQLLSGLVQTNVSSFGQIERHGELKQALELSGISVIPTLTTVKKCGDHVMTYLFHDNVCVRVNCGAAANPDEHGSTGGFTLYRIKDKKTFYDKWASRFIHSMKKPIPDVELMGQFLKACCDKEPLAYIPVTLQRAGNCTWKSAEVGLRAIIFINIFKVYKHYSPLLSDRECLIHAEKYSEVWLHLFNKCDRKFTLDRCSLPEIRKAIPDILFRGIEDGYRNAAKQFETAFENCQRNSAKPKMRAS